MTDHIPPEFNKVFKAVTELHEVGTDILENIKATKGTAYAMQVAAVSGLINIMRATNALICKSVPDLIVDVMTDTQLSAIEDLIEPFFYNQFPGDSELAVKQRHAACKEFHKNVTQFVDRRIAMEKKIGSVIVPKKDGGL